MPKIKNEKTEAKARLIAQSIVDEDTGSFLVAKRDANMEDMKRWELIAFRDRVHELVEELEPNKKIEVIYHN